MIDRQDWTPSSLEEWHEEFNYRAAIIEYEGGFTRTQAEQMAIKIVGQWPPTNIKSRSTP
jgi:hypothetical protein